MRLIVTFLALLVAVAVVTGLLREARGDGDEHPWRPQFALAAAAVAVGLMVAVIGSSIWSNVDGQRARARATEQLDPNGARLSGGAKLGLNVGFLDWARGLIPEGQDYYLYPSGPGTDSAVYQWSTYQLTPRLSVVDPGQADWLVFYGVEPPATDYDRASFDTPVRFAPGFFVAHRRAS
jgi:hypothetical protein